ncbi:MAG: hypothetical protein SynsKO_16890 [Synoicihabitans sp.]
MTTRFAFTPQFHMKTRSLIKLFGALTLALCGNFTRAAKITETISHHVAGFDIPMIVVSPDEGDGPFPVVYHVHGGGWNGGNESQVPDASIPAGFRLLTDELGIVHVGLAYRAKRQGNFEDALNDLRASIAWFEARADEFGVDITRVGFSGGSAGTPLSAVLAQEHPASLTYVGLYGVYDLLNNSESLFPDEQARVDFGLENPAAQRAASAWHQLRAEPPATLLFHGALDILTHPSQSTRFAAYMREQGAIAEAIVFSEVNHGFFSPRYPEEYSETLRRVAQFYVDHFAINPETVVSLDAKLEQQVAKYRARSEIDPSVLQQRWEGKHDNFTFEDETHGTWTDRKDRAHRFTYRIRKGAVELSHDSGSTTLYLQQDGRALYVITENDSRRNGQRFHYSATRLIPANSSSHQAP